MSVSPPPAGNSSSPASLLGKANWVLYHIAEPASVSLLLITSVTHSSLCLPTIRVCLSLTGLLPTVGLLCIPKTHFTFYHETLQHSLSFMRPLHSMYCIMPWLRTFSSIQRAARSPLSFFHLSTSLSPLTSFSSSLPSFSSFPSLLVANTIFRT